MRGGLVSIPWEHGQGRLRVVIMSIMEFLGILQGFLLWEGTARQISPREMLGKPRRLPLDWYNQVGGGKDWIKMLKMIYLGRPLVIFM